MRYVIACALSVSAASGLAQQRETSPFATPYPDPQPREVHPRDVSVAGTVRLNGQPLANAQISDGERIVLTDAGGAYALSFHVAENRFVTATRPTGLRPVSPWAVRIDPSEEREQYQIDFGFQPDSLSARTTWTFLQTSDSQFTSPADMALIRDDYAQITSMTDQPAFLACPGDLTMNGTHYELDMYREICTAAKIDLYNAFGGHDGNYSAPDYSVGNYEAKIGPPHFAWDYGGVHFTAFVTELHYLSEEARARQVAWIEADLAAQPPATPIVLISHIPPNRVDVSRWLDEGRNIIGGMFGHWHAVTQNEFRGVHFLNCSPIRGGDWGALTRTFRVNAIADGRLVGSEVRATGQYRRLDVIAPQGRAGPGAPIRVLAYDSSRRVQSVSVTISAEDDGEAAPAELPLEQIGQWTWGADLPEEARGEGPRQVAARVVDELGGEWTAASQFALTEDARPVVRPGSDWPSVVGGSAGHRQAGAALQPPLRVAWVANTGGRNQLAVSPIVYGNRVYVGVQSNDVGWTGAGIACYDAVTGAEAWRSGMDSSVRFSPAAIDGVIVAVSHQGVVYGFDAVSGRERWTRDLYPQAPSNIYRSVNKPVTICEGSALVARDNATAVLLDVKTGEVIREFAGATGIYYAFPGIGDETVYFGSRKMCEAYGLESAERLWDVAADTGKATSSPVLHDGRLYMNASQLHCYDLADGSLLWQRPASIGSNAVAAPVFFDQLVIANGATLRAFDAISGEPAWEHAYRDPNTPQNRRQRLGGMSAPIVAGDVLYVGGEDGWLYALEAATGRPLWEYHVGLPVKCWPAASGNALYVADYDGNLWAFVAESQ